MREDGSKYDKRTEEALVEIDEFFANLTIE